MLQTKRNRFGLLRECDGNMLTVTLPRAQADCESAAHRSSHASGSHSQATTPYGIPCRMGCHAGWDTADRRRGNDRPRLQYSHSTLLIITLADDDADLTGDQPAGRGLPQLERLQVHGRHRRGLPKYLHLRQCSRVPTPPHTRPERPTPSVRRLCRRQSRAQQWRSVQCGRK